MDLSAETVPADPNLAGRMDPGLNSFNMLILGMKKHFTPDIYIANMSGIQRGTLFLLQ